MTEREQHDRPGTTRAAGRAARRTLKAAAAGGPSRLAGGGFGSADRHRGDPSRPVPDRLPDDPDDRLAVPAAGDRGLRPGAGGAGHPGPVRRPRAGWRPRPEPASPWPPWPGTSCRSGSGCSGSTRSARPPASSPASWRWPPSWSWPRSRWLPPGERPGGRRGSGLGQIPCPDPPGGRPGGRSDRRRPGGGGAGAVRDGGGRSQLAPHRRPRARHWPEDHDDRRDDGPDQRQGLHALLVRPRHPGHLEVLRQLRRVLAAGDRHRRGRAGPAGQGRHDHPHRRLHASSPTTGTRCTPTSATPLPARPAATTSTSTAGSGTRCLSPGERTATEVTSTGHQPGLSWASEGEPPMAPPHTMQLAGKADWTLMTAIHDALRRDLDQLLARHGQPRTGPGPLGHVPRPAALSLRRRARGHVAAGPAPNWRATRTARPCSTPWKTSASCSARCRP